MSEATSESEFITKDSGARDEFETGSRRDSRTGKGRFDLIPHTILDLIVTEAPDWHEVEGKDVTGCLDMVWAGVSQYLDDTLDTDGIARAAYWALLAAEVEAGSKWLGLHRDAKRWAGGGYSILPPAALRRLAQLYERGAVKYGDSNWQKGQPLSRTLDSLHRHLNTYLSGDRAEDHLAAIAWNAITLCWTDAAIRRGDLPAALADL